MMHRVTFSLSGVIIKSQKAIRGDYMNIQKTGEFIKALRKEKNLTQLELAEKLNCTDKAVSRWETGKGLPDADMLLSLSTVFNVSINEILLGEKFVFSDTDNDSIPKENNEQIEEIISSTDENIVDILKEKEGEILLLNKSVTLLIIACCIQLLIFFVLPSIVSFIRPTAEPIVYLICASVANFVFAGLIKDKCRWYFPVFTAVSLFAPLISQTNEEHIFISFAAIFGVLSAVIMAVISGIRFLSRKFFCK